MIDKRLEVNLKKYIIANYDDIEERFSKKSKTISACYSPYHYSDDIKMSCHIPLLKEFKTTPKFAELLFKFIDEKKMKDIECYKKAGVDRRLFSKIKSDKDYSPSKKTILAFVFALELNKSEAMELLESGGYTLSHSYLRDVIVEYCLENKIYKLFDVNALLAKYNEELIIFE